MEPSSLQRWKPVSNFRAKTAEKKQGARTFAVESLGLGPLEAEIQISNLPPFKINTLHCEEK